MRRTTIMCDLCGNEGVNDAFFLHFEADRDMPLMTEDWTETLDICSPCVTAVRRGLPDGLADHFKQLHFKGDKQ